MFFGARRMTGLGLNYTSVACLILESQGQWHSTQSRLESWKMSLFPLLDTIQQLITLIVSALQIDQIVYTLSLVSA